MSFKRAIIQAPWISVSGTAASSPSWSCSNAGIDWLHAVISLQIHRGFRLSQRDCNQDSLCSSLQSCTPCNHHYCCCCCLLPLLPILYTRYLVKINKCSTSMTSWLSRCHKPVVHVSFITIVFCFTFFSVFVSSCLYFLKSILIYFLCTKYLFDFIYLH